MTQTSQALTLCVFRHGQTQWNVDRRFQGHIDIPLNEVGQQQAQALADQCQSLADDFPISHIYSSDLKRASHTAQAVADVFDIPVTTTPDLREARMGQVEGLTRDESIELMGQRFIDLWLGDPGHPEAKDLRFKDGESRAEVVERACALINTWKEKHAGETIAMSSHGGVVRHVLGTLLPDQQSAFSRIPNATLFVIRWHPEQQSWSLLLAP